MMAYMKIPQLDLSRYTSVAVEEWIPMVREIARTGRLWNGPQKEAFEKEFAAYLGVAYVAGCASGTDALTLSLRALPAFFMLIIKSPIGSFIPLEKGNYIT